MSALGAAETDVLDAWFQRASGKSVLRSALELASGPCAHSLELSRRGVEAAGVDLVSDGEWRRFSYVAVISDVAKGFTRDRSGGGREGPDGYGTVIVFGGPVPVFDWNGGNRARARAELDDIKRRRRGLVPMDVFTQNGAGGMPHAGN